MTIKELFKELETNNKLVQRFDKLEEVAFYIDIKGIDGHFWTKYADFIKWFKTEYTECFVEQVLRMNLKKIGNNRMGERKMHPYISVELYKAR